MPGLFPQHLKSFVARLGGAKAAPELGGRLVPDHPDNTGRFTVRRDVEGEDVLDWWDGRSEEARWAPCLWLVATKRSTTSWHSTSTACG